MPYEGDVTKESARQKFMPCYTEHTASFGHAMAWAFTSFRFVSTFPSGEPNVVWEDNYGTESAGWVANPGWDRFLVPFAGVMWNHENDLLPRRQGIMIAGGYCPKVWVDNRSDDYAHLGNDYGWHLNGGRPGGFPVVPNIPLGFGNTQYIIMEKGESEARNGETWPMPRAWSISWRQMPAHMVSLGTVTENVRNHVPCFINGSW